MPCSVKNCFSYKETETDKKRCECSLRKPTSNDIECTSVGTDDAAHTNHEATSVVSKLGSTDTVVSHVKSIVIAVARV